MKINRCAKGIVFFTLLVVVVPSSSSVAQSVIRKSATREEVKKKEATERARKARLEQEAENRRQFAAEFEEQERAKGFKGIANVKVETSNTTGGKYIYGVYFDMVLVEDNKLLVAYAHKKDYDLESLRDFVANRGEQLMADKQFVARIAKLGFTLIALTTMNEDGSGVAKRNCVGFYEIRP